MTSSRPYLIRALYDWILDNNLTPHILVDAGQEGVQVPNDYIQEGKILLNISPDAVQGLSLGNQYVEFNARFAGVARDIVVPIQAVDAIYARENGQGMMFGEEHDGEPPEPPSDKPGKPVLKVVK
jgi:stringent starvation protein B